MRQKYIKATLLIFTFVCMSFLSEGQECKCQKAGRDETTRPRANQQVIVIERIAYKKLWGVIEIISDPDPKPEVLVEVFDHPEYLLLNFPESESRRKPQRRIAACKTGPDGRFCFKRIPPGKYELRFSIDSNWNATQVYVVLDPNDHKGTKKEIRVPMHIGT